MHGRNHSGPINNGHIFNSELRSKANVFTMHMSSLGLDSCHASLKILLLLVFPLLPMTHSIFLISF